MTVKHQQFQIYTNFDSELLPSIQLLFLVDTPGAQHYALFWADGHFRTLLQTLVLSKNKGLNRNNTFPNALGPQNLKPRP